MGPAGRRAAADVGRGPQPADDRWDGAEESLIQALEALATALQRDSAPHEAASGVEAPRQENEVRDRYLRRQPACASVASTRAHRAGHPYTARRGARR